jgi:hypothetical protein
LSSRFYQPWKLARNPFIVYPDVLSLSNMLTFFRNAHPSCQAPGHPSALRHVIPHPAVARDNPSRNLRPRVPSNTLTVNHPLRRTTCRRKTLASSGSRVESVSAEETVTKKSGSDFEQNKKKVQKLEENNDDDDLVRCTRSTFASSNEDAEGETDDDVVQQSAVMIKEEEEEEEMHPELGISMSEYRAMLGLRDNPRSRYGRKI